MGAGRGKRVYGSFGGYMFTPGPLVYESNQFRVQTEWNEVNSYRSKSGKTNGSTYFSLVNIGQQFDSRGSSYDGSSEINNANPMSFDGKNDWIVPTESIFKKLIGTASGYKRNGSTVNGTANAHWARIAVSNYAGQSTVSGILFFPDDENIVGKTLGTPDYQYDTVVSYLQMN